MDSIPHVFDATLNQGTFIGVDKAGNKTSKEFMLNNITIGGGSTTFVGVDGIPEKWTNKDVTVRVGAQNLVEGVVDIEVGSVTASLPEVLPEITTGSAIQLDMHTLYADTGATNDTLVNNFTVSSNGKNILSDYNSYRTTSR